MTAIDQERLERTTTDGAVQHTSLRIEEQALKLFYEHGFKTTTMREIALACDLTPGALYNHFASKDELLSTLIVGIHRRMDLLLEGALDDAGDDPVDQLKSFCRAHALVHADNITEARVANREIGKLSPPALERCVEIRRKATTQLRDIVNRGCEAGVFDVANVVVVCNLILTMGMSIADWYRPNGDLNKEEMAELHGETALRMVSRRGQR